MVRNFRIPFSRISSSRWGQWIGWKKQGHPWKLSPRGLDFAQPAKCVAGRATQRLAWPGRPGTRHAWPGLRPASSWATKDGRVPNNSHCMVARCLPCEVANNLRKVAHFNRPIFQSNLFKSSPNAVVSLTGASASHLPSSCQSTHSLLAFV